MTATSTSTSTHTPHPGSRLDAVSTAAEHEGAAPGASHSLSGAEGFGIPIVQTHSDMPEECIPRTMFLSAANPYLLILPRDMRRRRAVIIPAGNAVMLCETKDLAQAAATFAAGGGTAPGPGIGAYITSGAVVAIESRDVMYAAITTTSTASPVTVIAERYAG